MFSLTEDRALLANSQESSALVALARVRHQRAGADLAERQNFYEAGLQQGVARLWLWRSITKTMRPAGQQQLLQHGDHFPYGARADP
ncbi:MAG: hypothetical protein U0Q16_03930 [Bryobacteraceae bacterium]